jgi:LuxR family quorum sensing-dependent transcriptional regulator
MTISRRYPAPIVSNRFDLALANPCCGDHPIPFMRLISQPTTRKRSNTLSAREIEVLTWVARGKSAWEIGEILHITKRTVDEHVRAAARKLGAVNRTQAVALAIRDRIIEV